MKKIVAIICALLIAWPIGIKVYIVTDWQLNRDYIAQNLCESRNDETSTCEGKCQLVKQLEKSDTNEKPFLPYAGLEKLELSAFSIITADKYTGQNAAKEKITYLVGDEDIIMPDIRYSVFHPPEINV